MSYYHSRGKPNCSFTKQRKCFNCGQTANVIEGERETEREREIAHVWLATKCIGEVKVPCYRVSIRAMEWPVQEEYISIA